MNKVKVFAEKHGTLLAIILGGVGIIVTIIVAGKLGSGGQGTGVLTDAAGNPLAGGAQVSPALSNADLSTLLQDLEQQILNWEQNYVPPNPPNPTPAPPPPTPAPPPINLPPPSGGPPPGKPGPLYGWWPPQSWNKRGWNKLPGPVHLPPPGAKGKNPFPRPPGGHLPPPGHGNRRKSKPGPINLPPPGHTGGIPFPNSLWGHRDFADWNGIKDLLTINNGGLYNIE